MQNKNRTIKNFMKDDKYVKYYGINYVIFKRCLF